MLFPCSELGLGLIMPKRECRPYTREEILQLEVGATSGSKFEFAKTCERWNRTPAAVICHLNKHGLTVLAKRPWSAWELHPTGMTPPAYAKARGIGNSTVNQAIHRLGLCQRVKKGHHRHLSDNEVKLLDAWFDRGKERDKMSQKLLEKHRGGKTLTAFADALGVSYTHIHVIAKRLGIKLPRNGRLVLISPDNQHRIEAAYLEELSAWGRSSTGEVWHACRVCGANDMHKHSPGSHGAHGCCRRCTARSHRRIKRQNIPSWGIEEFLRFAQPDQNITVKCGGCGLLAKRKYLPEKLNRYYPEWMCQNCRQNVCTALPHLGGPIKIAEIPPARAMQLAREIFTQKSEDNNEIR
jgi:hypothetical protein